MKRIILSFALATVMVLSPLSGANANNSDNGQNNYNHELKSKYYESGVSVKGSSWMPFGVFKSFIKKIHHDVDLGAPLISGVVVSDIDSDSVTISWVTNEEATTEVGYEDSNGEQYKIIDESLSLEHSVVLSDLDADEIYNFKVRSRDASGNIATSSKMEFETLGEVVNDNTAPVISDLIVSNISSIGATISFATDEGASVSISYGTTDEYGITINTDSGFPTAHSVVLTGLSAETEYHYKISVADESGNVSESADAMFTTSQSPDITGPAISDVTSVVESAITAIISWVTDEDASSKVYYSLNSPVDVNNANSIQSSALVVDHEIQISGLNVGTDYYYLVESTDMADNTSLSNEKVFTTLAEM